jgi:hypothetical protein
VATACGTNPRGTGVAGVGAVQASRAMRASSGLFVGFVVVLD